MNFEENDNTLICLFDSHVDTMVCTEIAPLLTERISTALEAKPDLHVDFDLKNTEYICSAFLRLCLLHCKQVGVPRFQVNNVSQNVKDVFDIAGLTRLMSVKKR